MSNYYNAIAIGKDAFSYRSSLAFGTSTFSYTDSIALGSYAQANAYRSIVLGYNAFNGSDNRRSVVIGSFANLQGQGKGGVLLGDFTTGNGNSIIALGSRAKAYSNYAMAFGYNALADKQDAIAAGRNAKALDRDTIVLGRGTMAVHNDAIAIGKFAFAYRNSLSFGQNTFSYIDAIALGSYAQANAYRSLVFGYDARNSLNSFNSIAIGSFAHLQGNSTDGVLLGSRTSGNGIGVLALGGRATAQSDYASAIGYNAQATLKHSVAIGAYSSTTDAKAINNAKIDDYTFNNFFGAIKNSGHIVSFGRPDFTRQLKFVAPGEVSEQSTDAINGSQLYSIAKTIIEKITASTVSAAPALTVDKAKPEKVDGTLVTDYQIDLADTTKNDIEKGVDAHTTVNNQGLTFAADNGNTQSQKLGSTLSLNGDSNITTKAKDNTVEITLNRNISLDSVSTGQTRLDNHGLTIKNGPSVTDKGIDAGNKKITLVANGTISANSKDAINGSQLYAEVHHLNQHIQAAKTEVHAGENVTISPVSQGSAGQTIYTVNARDTSSTVSTTSALTVHKAVPKKLDGTLVTDYQIDLASTTKNDIQKGVDAHTTVNNKGLTFHADSGSSQSQKLGSSITIKGDDNISTSAQADSLSIALKQDIKVSSIETNKLTIGSGDKQVSLSSQGLNNGGNRLSNVAYAQRDYDAVNLKQLNNVNEQIQQRLNKLNERLLLSQREYRAGIAGNNAAIALPQAALAGKSMLAASVGHYADEGAIAVGYSTVSHSGKVFLKLQGNANTNGKIGAGAGVGYQW
ncbi:YadA-like family protein [Nicoletella semolina]|nr:YadA-like family protein [Nicoletella semolina]